ncbi:hypothetical protein SCUCBS95973_005532 [Sporothrix curviconia]|uniref:Uncharacterized protein n=1 Tax=Sporothrix curviconia TaxID=1260050 RepID=A0ABP0BZM0_9PEZI
MPNLNNIRLQTVFASHDDNSSYINRHESRNESRNEIRHESSHHSHGHRRKHRDEYHSDRTDRTSHEPRVYRYRGPLPISNGQTLPMHMVEHSWALAENVRRGRRHRQPTYVLGMRPMDAFTHDRAGHILRGEMCTLAADCAVLVEKTQNKDGKQPMDLFQLIETEFDLAQGPIWKLWAFGSTKDQAPRELKTLQDVLDFVKERLWVAERGDEGADELFVHFVVETGASWPKLFAVTYEDDEKEEEEEEVVVEEQGCDDTKSDVTIRATPKIQARRAEVLKTFDEWEKDDKNLRMTYEEWQEKDRLKQERMKTLLNREQVKKVPEKQKQREETPREGRKTNEDRVREDRKKEEKRRKEYAEMRERDKERLRERIAAKTPSTVSRSENKDKLKDRTSRHLPVRPEKDRLREHAVRKAPERSTDKAKDATARDKTPRGAHRLFFPFS